MKATRVPPKKRPTTFMHKMFMRHRLYIGTFMHLDFYAPGPLGTRGGKNFFSKM